MRTQIQITHVWFELQIHVLFLKIKLCHQEASFSLFHILLFQLIKSKLECSLLGHRLLLPFLTCFVVLLGLNFVKHKCQYSSQSILPYTVKPFYYYKQNTWTEPTQWCSTHYVLQYNFIAYTVFQNKSPCIWYMQHTHTWHLHIQF